MYAGNKTKKRMTKKKMYAFEWKTGALVVANNIAPVCVTT